jgi:hypothetical protein
VSACAESVSLSTIALLDSFRPSMIDHLRGFSDMDGEQRPHQYNCEGVDAGIKTRQNDRAVPGPISCCTGGTSFRLLSTTTFPASVPPVSKDGDCYDVTSEIRYHAERQHPMESHMLALGGSM